MLAEPDARAMPPLGQRNRLMNRYDVLTFGESMMRLTPPGFLRIEQTQSFDIWVGGTESNTAVGLARLGMKVAWLSRLPRSPLGRYISNRIAQYGVDVSQVVWADDERLGIYFHEKAQAPRASEIIYDRRDSAISRMRAAATLPEGLFQPGLSQLLSRHRHHAGHQPDGARHRA